MDDYPLADLEPDALVLPPGLFSPRPHHHLARKANVFAESSVERPALEFFCLPGGRLFSGYNDFLLLNGAGKVLRRSLHSSRLVAAYRQACEAGRIIRQAGRVFIIQDMSSARNYCHWLCDWLPRLLMLREMFPGLMKVVFSEDLAAFQVGMLHYIPNVQPIYVPWGGRAGVDGAVLQADELVFLSSTLDFVHPAYYCEPSHLRSLDRLVDLIGPGAGCYPEAIFVPRMRAGRRVLDGESNFIDMLNGAGVTTVYPEDMSVEEQIRTFTAARTVIGIHGGGLANILFARRCERVVEILPPNYGTWTFQMLADGIGTRYYYWYEGEPDAQLLRDDTRDRAFAAPLDRLLAAVMEVIAAP